MNAHAERFVRSIKEKCLAKIVPEAEPIVGRVECRSDLEGLLRSYHRAA